MQAPTPIVECTRTYTEQDAVHRLNTTQTGFNSKEKCELRRQLLGKADVPQMRKWLSRIGYTVCFPFPLNEAYQIPNPNTSPAHRPQQPQRRPRRRNKRQRINLRIRKLDPQPLPLIHRRTAQNRPLHLPASHNRARENPDKLAAYVRRTFYEVLLRSMGCARGIRGTGRTRSVDIETNVFPVPDVIVDPRVYERGR